MKLLFLLLIGSACYSQDSVRVVIDKKRTTADGSVYVWFSKVERDSSFFSVCRCPPGKIPNKGDTIFIKRKDVIKLKYKL